MTPDINPQIGTLPARAVRLMVDHTISGARRAVADHSPRGVDSGRYKCRPGPEGRGECNHKHRAAPAEAAAPGYVRRPHNAAFDKAPGRPSGGRAVPSR